MSLFCGMLSLVIDASCPKVQLGILIGEEWVDFQESSIPALQSIFLEIESMLDQNKLRLNDISHFLISEGPGSTLGIRVSTIACKTWKALGFSAKIQTFNILHLCALIIKKMDIVIVTESIENRWLCLFVDSLDGPFNEIKEFTLDELSKINRPLYFLPQRKTSIPLNHNVINYSLRDHSKIFKPYIY